jgi:hypothetical protein
MVRKKGSIFNFEKLRNQGLYQNQFFDFSHPCKVSESTYTKFDNQWVFVAYFKNCTTLVITLKFEYELCEIVVGHNTNALDM